MPYVSTLVHVRRDARLHSDIHLDTGDCVISDQIGVAL